MTAPLLIELLVEELPPKALRRLGEAFAHGMLKGLSAQGLCAAQAEVVPFATPRRLAVRVSGVLSKAQDRAVTQKLMPVQVALTADGAPTPALLKKLQALGLDASVVPQLLRQPDGKAEALFAQTMVPGATLAQGLQLALNETLAQLPIPKVMQYQLADGWSSVNFVRPAHGLVALHGADVVPVAALGLTSGRVTRGHRFESSGQELVLADALAYESTLLNQGAVLASYEARRADILAQLTVAGQALGLQPIQDDALLDEVTALVERPRVLTCEFEAEYLEVPQECLILTMKANQKYFPLLDAQGQLTRHFLVVSNVSPADASRVIEGNERVVRPRLADARFFYNQDRKTALADRVPQLDRVVYHGKLGSQGERVGRVRAIAAALAQAVAGPLGQPALPSLVDRAALLAKADLLTDMVGEFPELQGIMGAYYARHDGEAPDVAMAIEDHYRPRFAGDALPRGQVGALVALADKLETLIGLFGIGQLPTGDRDPFALRRHALGVLRILTEGGLPLGLDEALSLAQAAFPAALRTTDVTEPLQRFIDDRLAVSLKDQGYTAQEVDAVLALRPQRLQELGERLAAVREFAGLPEAAALAAANKRVGNILKKIEGEVPSGVSVAQLVEPAEQALHQALEATQPLADAAFAEGRYTESLKALAVLRGPVDAFFDGVMVNAEDAGLRRNRQALLARLHGAMNRVADLARLAS